jgi:hypothetical protein
MPPTAITLQMSLDLTGCAPWGVEFDRVARPVPSLRWDDAAWYQHPEEHIVATVYVPQGCTIAEVLEYHYPGTWTNLIIPGYNDGPQD